MLAESVGATGNGGGGGAEDYILIRDEKPSGTRGGSSTAGVWQTRDFTIVNEDDGGHASLASNQITLAAGKYKVKAHAANFTGISHQIKLYNVTDASDIVIGTSEASNSGGIMQTRSFLEGRFTIAASKVIELQHRCDLGVTVRGLGEKCTFGVIEVYAAIEFWKEAA